MGFGLFLVQILAFAEAIFAIHRGEPCVVGQNPGTPAKSCITRQNPELRSVKKHRGLPAIHLFPQIGFRGDLSPVSSPASDRRSRTLAAIETAVGIGSNDYRRFDVPFTRFANEANVLDTQSPVDPLLFVKRSDGKDVVGCTIAIQIVGLPFDPKIVGLDQGAGVSKKEVAVGFEMNESVATQYLRIKLDKTGGSHPLVDLAHLRIGKGDPDFRNFSGSKEMAEHLNLRAQKGRIIQLLLHDRLGAGPDASAFNVNSDEILIRKSLRQPDGIFPFSASQFKYDRMVVPETPFVPATPHLKSFFFQGRKGILKYVGIATNVFKFL
jgi:hypothetical protein